ncbi:hypothetical protein [Kitasatospora arboriphila]|uniref:Uncharacterized protein n=1 Tax=Kitasatospora arboriphila TaxID=258052 RepID=A0ABP4EYJ5_9ACTN
MRPVHRHTRDWRDAVLVGEEELAAAARGGPPGHPHGAGPPQRHLVAGCGHRLAQGPPPLLGGPPAGRCRDEPPAWVHYKGVAIAPVMPQVLDPTEAPAGAGRWLPLATTSQSLYRASQ